MKGKVTIELKDINTDKVEKIEGNNLVTNAVNRYIGYNQQALIKRQTQSPTTKGIFSVLNFPASESMLGGLLVFENVLTQNVNKMFLGANDKIIAVGDRLSHQETYKGSLNTSETGKTANGYKHVWEFNTSQCNGTISALSLTHTQCVADLPDRWAISGTDNLYDFNQYIITKYNNASSTTDEGDIPFFYDKDTKYLYSVYMPKSKSTYSTLKLTRCKYDIDNIPFSSSLDFSESETLEEAYDLDYHTDGVHGVYYGELRHPFGVDIEHKKAYIAPAVFGMAGVQYNSFHFTEVDISNWILTHKIIHIDINSVVDEQHACVFNGYFYYVSRANKKIYKVNLQDETDVTIILDLSDIITAATVTCRLIPQSNCIIYTQSTTPSTTITIFADDSYIINGAYIQEERLSTNIGDMACWNYSGGSRLIIEPRYLGTIYNLPTPITKTSNQTMKITYELIDA